MELRDKISLEIEKGTYKSTLPIGIFKKRSKTQYLVSIDDKEDSFATISRKLRRKAPVDIHRGFSVSTNYMKCLGRNQGSPLKRLDGVDMRC